MNAQELIETASTLIAADKGLLAMDESNPTCNQRFAKLGIPQTAEARRGWRELIVTTPGLVESISGVILYDETIRQRQSDGTPFVKALTDAGIISGIKVDTGETHMAGHPGEQVTEGLDGLRDRLTAYARMGARFAKWRAVITVGERIPSRGCIEVNAQTLARYAALCQGSRTGPRRRAGGAHGRRAYAGAEPRGDRGSSANGFQPTVRTTRNTGGCAPEAQHGASGFDLSHARNGGRGGRRHGEVSLASRARRRSRNRVFVRRAIR